MIAKYPGKCYLCGSPITVGKDEYDFDQKRSFHRLCVEQEEEQGPTQEQIALADRLGFTHLSWERLLFLSGEARAKFEREHPEALEWDGGKAMPSSDEIDCIRPEGGHA